MINIALALAVPVIENNLLSIIAPVLHCQVVTTNIMLGFVFWWLVVIVYLLREDLSVHATWERECYFWRAIGASFAALVILYSGSQHSLWFENTIIIVSAVISGKVCFFEFGICRESTSVSQIWENAQRWRLEHFDTTCFVSDASTVSARERLYTVKNTMHRLQKMSNKTLKREISGSELQRLENSIVDVFVGSSAEELDYLVSNANLGSLLVLLKDTDSRNGVAIVISLLVSTILSLSDFSIGSQAVHPLLDNFVVLLAALCAAYLAGHSKNLQKINNRSRLIDLLAIVSVELFIISAKIFSFFSRSVWNVWAPMLKLFSSTLSRDWVEAATGFISSTVHPIVCC